MVKFWVFFALVVAAIGLLSNCEADATHSPYHFNVNVGSNGNGERGSGVEKSETRQVGAFSRIHAEGIGVLNVDVKLGNAGGSLEISTDDNLLKLMSTKVVDGTLEVTQTESVSPRTGLTLRLAVPALAGVHLEGANTLNLTIDSDKPLEIHLEGAGRVAASGKVGPLTVYSEGAGSVEASELVSSVVDITIEGAGKARVNATESLKGRIEGAGLITYLGNPKSVEKEIEGVGHIRKAY